LLKNERKGGKVALLKKSKPSSEKELHCIIEKELDALEEGLELLKYEFDLGIGKGIPDFLCVDSGGRLVIIEVKLQEDENILFQALRYYSVIDKDRYAIRDMFSDKKINHDEHPRIVLIAEKFSDDVRRLSTLVVPDVELYEYTVLQTSDNDKGLCYHPVSLPKLEEVPSRSVTIDDHREYITKDSLKPIFNELLEKIKGIGEGIEEYATQGYVGIKYKGRQIAYVSGMRKAIDIGAVLIDDNGRVIDYPSQRIETGNEDCSDIIEKIKKSFVNVGGKLNEPKDQLK